MSSCGDPLRNAIRFLTPEDAEVNHHNLQRIAIVVTATIAALSLTAAGETTMSTTVKREKDKVWLEGVTGWFVGDQESSVHAAQEAVMQAAGQDVTYAYLVGVSGLAFRMQVSKDGLCPSSPHSCCGYECVARSTQSLPLNVRIFEVKPDQEDKVAEARQAIVQSIDRGIPVQYGSEEDGIIVGYQKDGAEWICLHPMRDGGSKTFVETAWPWGIAVFGAAKTDVTPWRDLAIGALEQALEMAGTEDVKGYYVGFKAWQEYIAQLKALLAADAEARAAAMLGNAWIYECLAQYRTCAATYLREIADEFDDAAATHLRSAAALYDRMANAVLRDEEHCVVTIAPYAWALKEGETWTDEMLQEQIRRLEEALPIEREALAGIEAALATIRGKD